MNILGLNMLGAHDASACLLREGQLVAYGEEERFSRRKKAPRELPAASIRHCLQEAEIDLNQVDAFALPFAVYETPFNEEAPSAGMTFGMRTATIGDDPRLRRLLLGIGGVSDDRPVYYISHHLAHAASAYRLSTADTGALLIADGEGDHVSTTLAVACDGEMAPLFQAPVEHSLGFFYTAVTMYLGLGSDGEGKTMGLAPYGKDDGRFDEYFTLTTSGYEVDLPASSTGEEPVARWLRLLNQRFGSPRRRTWTLDHRRSRLTETTEPEPADADIAAAAQGTLERVLSHLARTALRESGTSTLLVAGGVHLNCSANGVLNELPGVDMFFAQPLGHDAGATVGAALEVAHALREPRPTPMADVDWGPGFSDDTIEQELIRYGVDFERTDDAARAAAEHLAAGQIVGWFQGRAEAGPRALGRRSILASPRTTDLRDRVNRVKRRALWRPLSPSIREERASEVFVSPTQGKYMIVRTHVRDAWRAKLPGITHVDGSARPQLVSHETNPHYWNLLKHFEELVGLPCIINTSFNDEAEPIVCSPVDAIRTFATTEIDVLIIGQFIVAKRHAKDLNSGMDASDDA